MYYTAYKFFTHNFILINSLYIKFLEKFLNLILIFIHSQIAIFLQKCLKENKLHNSQHSKECLNDSVS